MLHHGHITVEIFMWLLFPFSGRQIWQVDICGLLWHFLDNHVWEKCSVGPQKHGFWVNMWRCKEFSRRGKVNRERCTFEPDPVNQRPCHYIPDSYAPIKTTRYEPLLIRLWEAYICNLVLRCIWEVSYFLKVCLCVQYDNPKITSWKRN